MAKRTIKGKEIEDYLHAEGFKELKVSEKPLHPARILTSA